MEDCKLQSEEGVVSCYQFDCECYEYNYDITVRYPEQAEAALRFAREIGAFLLCDACCCVLSQHTIY